MSEARRARIQQQLGMSHGAARNRLVNMLLFDMAKQLGEDTCYRCGNKIESIDEFSIDHIDWWEGLPDAETKFFDLGNIAFSHPACNRAYSRGNLVDRITVQCDYCGADIKLLPWDYRARTKRGQEKFYCNRSCFSEKHGYREFTEDEVIEIRRRHNLGESTRNIAKEFGKSHVLVYNCAIKKSYVHIE